MLWAPVALGLGAAFYLALPNEPPLPLMVWLFGIVTVLALLARRGGGKVAALVILVAVFTGGVLAGTIRTQRVAAPVLAKTEGLRRIEGWVIDVASPGVSGGRMLIAPVFISGVRPEDMPHRIRVTVARDAIIGPGAAVTFRTILGPPPPPASPGAYDFARDAWFDAVGGVGFSREAPMFTRLEQPPWRLRMVMAINAVRWDLARQIIDAMNPEPGAIAAAMVTGHEAWITEEQTEAMRASGLAHILSISGMHMAIVGGFVFAAVRVSVAAWPWVALRVPGKKAAALAGLAAVGVYLVISGAPAPAERAAITASVAFLAILFDRRAISLHALAVAALVILVAQPEAASSPGFQMSFAATAALVALVEAWRPPPKEISVPWPIRATQAVCAWLAVSIGVSFVAGMATGPFAMQHFNRVAMWGLPANLLTAPLSSFVIMPFLAIGAVLEPLGLGAPFLAVAGWGIDAMTAMAEWFGAAPGADALVPSAPSAALPVAFLGIMILCLWNGRLRWVGLPLSLAVLIWPRPAVPDVWIDAEGAAAAVRSGRAGILLRPEARRFGAEFWMRRRGLTEQAHERMYICSRYTCQPGEDAPVRIAATWTRRAPKLDALCTGAEVVIMRGRRTERPAACDGVLVLDGDDFAAGGAAELYRTAAGWRIVWAQPLRGKRPWVR
ncbi:ComEC/Rec2 family competence protein [Caulobacter sp. NIBR2454]|uniref:ComEC/Rec2 family competence protein n=1 Tax=Caulobacter sp. NIBR2454 TaxID=3015996 RepID=UPI0022B6EA23|nr:ComEC/Rec2 family competence protein [Caulobacter sp. NIBR2454]